MKVILREFEKVSVDSKQSSSLLVGAFNFFMLLSSCPSTSPQASLHSDMTFLSALWQILLRRPETKFDSIRWHPLKLASWAILIGMVEKQAPQEKVLLSNFLDVLEANTSLPLTTELLTLFAVSFATPSPPVSDDHNTMFQESFQLWVFCLGWVIRSKFGHRELACFYHLSRSLLSFLDGASPNIGSALPTGSSLLFMSSFLLIIFIFSALRLVGHRLTANFHNLLWAALDNLQPASALRSESIDYFLMVRLPLHQALQYAGVILFVFSCRFPRDHPASQSESSSP